MHKAIIVCDIQSTRSNLFTLLKAKLQFPESLNALRTGSFKYSISFPFFAWFTQLQLQESSSSLEFYIQTQCDPAGLGKVA